MTSVLMLLMYIDLCTVLMSYPQSVCVGADFHARPEGATPDASCLITLS